MPIYQIEVLETLTRLVDVEADTKSAAVDDVKTRYNNQEIVLTSDDCVGCDINCTEDL